MRFLLESGSLVKTDIEEDYDFLSLDKQTLKIQYIYNKIVSIKH